MTTVPVPDVVGFNWWGFALYLGAWIVGLGAIIGALAVLVWLRVAGARWIVLAFVLVFLVWITRATFPYYSDPYNGFYMLYVPAASMVVAAGMLFRPDARAWASAPRIAPVQPVPATVVASLGITAAFALPIVPGVVSGLLTGLWLRVHSAQYDDASVGGTSVFLPGLAIFLAVLLMAAAALVAVWRIPQGRRIYAVLAGLTMVGMIVAIATGAAVFAIPFAVLAYAIAAALLYAPSSQGWFAAESLDATLATGSYGLWLRFLRGPGLRFPGWCWLHRC